MAEGPEKEREKEREKRERKKEKERGGYSVICLHLTQPMTAVRNEAR